MLPMIAMTDGFDFGAEDPFGRWHSHHDGGSRSSHSIDLANHMAVVDNMLKHLGAQYLVKRVIPKREPFGATNCNFGAQSLARGQRLKRSLYLGPTHRFQLSTVTRRSNLYRTRRPVCGPPGLGLRKRRIVGIANARGNRVMERIRSRRSLSSVDGCNSTAASPAGMFIGRIFASPAQQTLQFRPGLSERQRR